MDVEKIKKNMRCIQESTGRGQQFKQKMKGEEWKLVKNIKGRRSEVHTAFNRKEEDPR